MIRPTSPVSVQMRHLSPAVRNAYYRAALSKAHWVCFHTDKPEYTVQLTTKSASQKWQKKACKVPTRNEAPTTQRVGDALLIIAALCIAGRFAARWWMQNNNLGWDDWTILAAFLLLIPSTIIVKLSWSPSTPEHSAYADPLPQC
jgi:hypothetical protein